MKRVIELFQKYKQIQTGFIIAKNVTMFSVVSGIGIYGYYQYNRFNANKELIKEKLINYKERSIEKVNSLIPSKSNLQKQPLDDQEQPREKLISSNLANIKQKLENINVKKSETTEKIEGDNQNNTLSSELKAKVQQKIEATKNLKDKISQNAEGYNKERISSELKSTIQNKLESAKGLQSKLSKMKEKIQGDNQKQ